MLVEVFIGDYDVHKMFNRLLKGYSYGCSINLTATTKVITMFGSKRDLIFYIVAANLIGILLGVIGADMFVILISSLIGPPILLLIFRILRYVLKI